MPWLSQEDYDDFTNGLRNFIQNGGREGGWPVLKDGMEMRPLDNVFKPVDVNDLEARDRINIAVCNAFQISPENIGFRTGTNPISAPTRRSSGTWSSCRTLSLSKKP